MARLNLESSRLREFAALCALGVFAIFSSTMAKSPTLSLFAKSLGTGTAEIGVIAAASTVVGIFTNVAAGTLSDIYGRKRCSESRAVCGKWRPSVNSDCDDTACRTYCWWSVGQGRAAAFHDDWLGCDCCELGTTAFLIRLFFSSPL